MFILMATASIDVINERDSERDYGWVWHQRANKQRGKTGPYSRQIVS